MIRYHVFIFPATYEIKGSKHLLVNLFKEQKTKTFPELIKDNFDFLNIDCEGNDFKILKTIDLKRYTPKMINIEVSSKNKQYIYNYMNLNGYKILEIKSL